MKKRRKRSHSPNDNQSWEQMTVRWTLLLCSGSPFLVMLMGTWRLFWVTYSILMRKWNVIIASLSWKRESWSVALNGKVRRICLQYISDIYDGVQMQVWYTKTSHALSGEVFFSEAFGREGVTKQICCLFFFFVFISSLSPWGLLGPPWPFTGWLNLTQTQWGASGVSQIALDALPLCITQGITHIHSC